MRRGHGIIARKNRRGALAASESENSTGATPKLTDCQFSQSVKLVLRWRRTFTPRGPSTRNPNARESVLAASMQFSHSLRGRPLNIQL